MAFFGLEQNDRLERERQHFLESNGGQADLAVYTWGEENYDGLGDALNEGGDDLNDETFGGSGPVGKDFDFAGQTASLGGPTSTNELETLPQHYLGAPGHMAPSYSGAEMPSASSSRWDDRSALAAFGHPNLGPSGSFGADARAMPSSAFSPFDQPQEYMGPQPTYDRTPLSRGSPLAGRSAQEIEQEMLLNAQRARLLAAQQQPSPILQQRMQSGPGLPTSATHPQYYGQPGMDGLRDDPYALQAQAQAQAQARAGPASAPPPPRMHPHSASPRFHQLQQQLQISRQQEAFQLQDLKQQLQLEQLTRQLREQELRGPGAPVPADRRFLGERGTPPPRALAELQQLRRHSPAVDPHLQQLTPQAAGYATDQIQMQQLLLHRAANAEFMREVGASEEVAQRIMEAERMEEKRRIKSQKMRQMAHYNELMTQSDKDFITRIQVSQLVTLDPYEEDFYAQIYGQIMRSRMGIQGEDTRVLNFGPNGGVGLGVAQRPGGRRPGAMHKMEAQVEKIVQAARLREKEKGASPGSSLQGALGKTAARSYKAAPRQLLQVNADKAEEGDAAAKKATHLTHEALGITGGTGGLTRREPLTRAQALGILEQLFDKLGQLEHRERREPRPPPEDVEALEHWMASGEQVVQELWDQLQVEVPLEASDPHPFVSLLMPAKGKRLLPRMAKWLGRERSLTVLSLIVATFSQVDVVARAPLLDSIEPSELRAEIERQTHLWQETVQVVFQQVVNQASLRIITSLFAMMMHRNNIVAVAGTEPGLDLLTMLLSRVEQLLSPTSTLPVEEEEVLQWQATYGLFFQMLSPNFLLLFPSVRITGGTAYNDALPRGVDGRVWMFLAVLAVLAPAELHPVLVTGLREKILAEVAAARDALALSEDERLERMTHLNWFLMSLGLDSSQIKL